MLNRIALLIMAGVLSCSVARAQQRTALDIYFVDVEGGQATLFVSPSGQSMLVDAGFPIPRDAERIASVAAQAGITQIDYMVVTHYHGDHVGGVAELAARIPIKTFVDHGPILEQTLNVPKSFAAYEPVRAKGQHLVAQLGTKLPIRGMDVHIVSAAAETITKPLPGAGAANPLCSSFEPKDETKDILLGGENGASVGMVIALGKFRMLDLGDLTWNREHELACPKNLLGSADLYLTTHHGQNISGLPMLVRAMSPRVAVMNNGAKKGGHVDTFDILKQTPGLTDLWQLHYAVDAGDRNAPEQFIANPDETTAHFIKVTARNDGSFTVSNSRNGYSKQYGPRN